MVGGYSNVYRVVEEGSNNVFALKRMLVSAEEMDLVKREVSLMVLIILFWYPLRLFLRVRENVCRCVV
jgi:hypothetical protein